jgi:peptide/nickel transport system substrate-binding protein
MKRRDILKSASAGAIALAAPRLANAADSAALRFVPQADLAVLDPVFTTAYVTRNHAFMVFDTLYGIDEAFNPQPQMLAGHTVENDGKLWKLTLRPGLKFHDGERCWPRMRWPASSAGRLAMPSGPRCWRSPTKCRRRQIPK